MKTRNILFAAAALSTMSALADQRSENDARLVAQQYFAAQTQVAATTAPKLSLVAEKQLRRAAAAPKQQVEGSLTTPYFVYNREGGGYVIVSGSTETNAVLGYSDHDTFDAANIPDGLRYWLGFAAQAVQYVDEHPEAAVKGPLKASALSHIKTPGLTFDPVDYTKDVKPLLETSRLGNIQWNQNAPYNNDCPSKNGTRCFTGCMATAMSQVMAYHQWPDRPSGSAGGQPISVYSYDWSKVLPTYKGGQGNAEQKAMVALINHHVGLALSMEYGTDQSGSVSTMYARALRENFKYNDRVALINRDNYTYGEWVTILLNEFNHNRPVLYDGVSNDGGHAFVIDGYRAADGFFHVNWGWEGMSDGYYDIVLLNPQETGIGATLSSGFTTYQDAVVNIEPDQSKELNYYPPIQGYGMQGNLVVGTGYAELAQGDRNGYISFENMPNLDPESFNGKFGAVFTDLEGNEVGRAEAGNVTSAGASMQTNPHATPSGGYFTIPQLSDGEYRVFCYVQDAEGNFGVIRTTADVPNFMTMKQADGRAFFQIADHHPTGLQVKEWAFDKQAIAYGSTGLSVTLVNTSDQPEYGSLGLQLAIPNRMNQSLYCEFQYFAPGEERTFIFPFTFEEYGTYEIRTFNFYRLNGGGLAEIIDPRSKSFDILRGISQLLQQLADEIENTQSILNRAKLSGAYPETACNTLQAAIDKAKNTNTAGLDAQQLNDLIKELKAALATFYKNLDTSSSKTHTWSYVGNAAVDQGWSQAPGVTGYYGISIPEEDLSPYIGGQVVGLQGFFGRYAKYGSSVNSFSGDDITVRILLFDFDGARPGNRVLAQSEEFTPTYYQYDNYLFNEPYTIGEGGLFCVAEVTLNNPPQRYSTMASCKSVTTEGACWMNNGNGWEDMYGSYGSNACAHALKALIVGGSAVSDAKLTEVKTSAVAVNSDITVTGKITNLSPDDISSYTLAWSHDDDGQEGTKTFNTRIAKGATAEFTLTVPGYATAKLHNLRVKVTKVGNEEDAIPSNSTVDLQIPVTARKYTRNVVCEENTGAACGYCPRGIVTFDYMKEKYKDEFIGISIHNFNNSGNDADLYYTGTNIAPLLVYLSTAPSGMLNRSEAGYTKMNQAETESLFLEQQRTCIAQITGTATVDLTKRTFSVTTETEFGYDYSDGNYAIGYAIVEDGCNKGGMGYNQTNYYSQISYNYGLGTMGGWESKGGVVRGVVYDDVFRDFLPAYTGQPGSVPTKGEGGKPMSYTYTASLPAKVTNVKNVRIIPMLIDVNSKEVLNAVNLRPTFDGTDGIDTVLAPTSDAPAYDLSGRRTNTTNGVTIQSGKKVMK